MNRISGLTGLLLVGAIFFAFGIVFAAASAQTPENLPKVGSYLPGVLKADGIDIIFPWAERYAFFKLARHPEYIPRAIHSSADREDAESESKTDVKDLRAFNCVKERNLIFDTAQYGDANSESPANSLDIIIDGNMDKKMGLPMSSFNEDIFEKNVDNALNSEHKQQLENAAGQIQNQRSGILGNSMNIHVSGITVSAVNTVPGGSAVANSNIVIKPVQIIVAQEEIDEKLK